MNRDSVIIHTVGGMGEARTLYSWFPDYTNVFNDMYTLWFLNIHTSLKIINISK